MLKQRIFKKKKSFKEKQVSNYQGIMKLLLGKGTHKTSKVGNALMTRVMVK